MSFGGDRADDSKASGGAQRRQKPKAKALVYEPEGVRVVPVAGRVRWMLERLIAAGANGFTAADAPAGTRVSHYVFRLRQEGIRVDMEREPHGGPFSGNHGRYRLLSKVALREPVATGGRAA